MSAWLGDPKIGKYYDDQNLVTQDGVSRRLFKIEVWCTDYVHQFSPWYKGKNGDVRHWQYGTNENGGAYHSLDINDGEAINYLRLDKTNVGPGERIAYFSVSKGLIGGWSNNRSQIFD